MKDVLPVDQLKELVRYDPETGLIYWRSDRRPNIKAGDVAGTTNSHGYLQIVIKSRAHLGHRVGWALVHGDWPAGMIDHVNGVRSDNRLCNLRLATGAQNQANRGVRKDSKTGLRGVRYDRKSGKWAASIQVGGFATAEEASAEYMRLARICYGEFAPSALIHVARALRGLDGA